MRFEDESHGSFSSDKSFSSEEDDTSSNQITTRRSTKKPKNMRTIPANAKNTANHNYISSFLREAKNSFVIANYTCFLYLYRKIKKGCTK